MICAGEVRPKPNTYWSGERVAIAPETCPASLKVHGCSETQAVTLTRQAFHVDVSWSNWMIRAMRNVGLVCTMTVGRVIRKVNGDIK
jgi:hypothetical protein